MERTIVIVAVVFAIMCAAGGVGMAYIGANGIMDVTDQQVGVAPGRLAPRAYAAGGVTIRNAAAVLRVVPEDRADVSVEITNPGGAPMPVVTLAAGRVDIDGRLQGRVINCGRLGFVSLLGYGGLERMRLPVITVRTPRAVDLNVDGAVWSDVAAAQSVTIQADGCGDTVIANVAGPLTLRHRGSGDTRAAALGAADIDLAGSGDVELGAVSGATNIDIAGSADVTIASTNGLETHVAGSGDIEVATATGPLNVTTAGSGDVSIGAGTLTAVMISTSGSGSVLAQTANAGVVHVRIAGSGDAEFANVAELEATTMGSGSVRVASVAGRNSSRSMGSGEVIVGR